jgi:hypothetical protein
MLKRIPKCWVFKTNERSVCGIPDLIGLINGKFFALELKVGYNKATNLQLYTLNQIIKAGGLAYVVYPENLDEVMEELKHV